MKKLFVIIFVLLSSALFVNGQILRPVKWSYGSKRTGKNEAVVFIKATIDEGWHIYSTTQPDGGPVRTSFIFTSSKAYEPSGGIAAPKPLTKFETSFNMDVQYFENAVVFRQKVILKNAHAVIAGKLNYMVCNDQKCLPPEDISFNIPIK